MNFIDTLFLVGLVSFTLTAALSDLRTRKLPNWLTVSAFAVAVIAHTALNGLSGLGFSLLGFAAGFSVLLVLWLIGGGGGGDVKLMGALGAWLGASLTLQVFLVSAVLIAMFMCLVFLFSLCTRGFTYVGRRYLAGTFSGTAKLGWDENRRRQQRIQCRIMPYAVPVALSTWLVLAMAWSTTGLPL